MNCVNSFVNYSNFVSSEAAGCLSPAFWTSTTFEQSISYSSHSNVEEDTQSLAKCMVTSYYALYSGFSSSHLLIDLAKAIPSCSTSINSSTSFRLSDLVTKP